VSRTSTPENKAYAFERKDPSCRLSHLQSLPGKCPLRHALALHEFWRGDKERPRPGDPICQHKVGRNSMTLHRSFVFVRDWLLHWHEFDPNLIRSRMSWE
jgi:hypothetical protein